MRRRGERSSGRSRFDSQLLWQAHFVALHAQSAVRDGRPTSTIFAAYPRPAYTSPRPRFAVRWPPLLISMFMTSQQLVSRAPACEPKWCCSCRHRPEQSTSRCVLSFLALFTLCRRLCRPVRKAKYSIRCSLFSSADTAVRLDSRPLLRTRGLRHPWRSGCQCRPVLTKVDRLLVAAFGSSGISAAVPRKVAC